MSPPKKRRNNTMEKKTGILYNETVDQLKGM